MENRFLAAAAAFLLFAGVAALANTALAYPGPGNGTSTSGMMDDKSMYGNTTIAADNGTKMMGVITSIQNNEQGQPAWIVGGHWKMGHDNSTGSMNATDFHAILCMVMLDGSAMHMHEVSNFTQTEPSTSSANSTTITGTSTVTMREGPVHDVPTFITISQDKVISIEFDLASTDNHFGNTPIYGMVASDDMMMHMGTMTSGMADRHMNASMWQDGNTTASMTEDTWK